MKEISKRAAMLALAASTTVGTGLSPARSQDADDLAKKLANPVANLISVPVQNNFDFGAGPRGDGFAYTANIQPVIPIPLNDDWLILSRTIIPIAYRDYLPEDHDFGLGDINASLFLSPKAPSPDGFIWGLGPVFLLPTATDDFLGAGKFGLGPTGVLARQAGPWTVGVLANHVWSVAGDDERPDISQSFVQPFVSYAIGGGRTLSFNAETGYDWNTEQWTVPLNVGVSQVFKVGKQAMSFQVGARYYAEAPEGAPEWGLRTTLTFLFPEK